MTFCLVFEKSYQSLGTSRQFDAAHRLKAIKQIKEPKTSGLKLEPGNSVVASRQTAKGISLFIYRDTRIRYVVPKETYRTLYARRQKEKKIPKSTQIDKNQQILELKHLKS